MKKNFSVFIAFFIVIVSLVLIFFTASFSLSSLWKGYIVLYTSKDIPENSVLSILEKKGITDVITLSSQRIPYVSIEAPVQLSDSSQYLNQRNAFFSDKNGSLRLFYIPEDNIFMLKNAVAELSELKNQGTVGLDLNTRYPWIIPCVSLIVFILLTIVSKAKSFVFIGCFSPLFYSFCHPIYTSGTGAILFMYAIYLASNLWPRQRMKKVLQKSFFYWIFVLLPIVLLFIVSIKEALIFLLIYPATFCSLYIFNYYRRRKQKRLRFSPTPIITANMIPLKTIKNARLLLVPAFGAGIFCIFYIFSGFFYVDNSENDLYFPAPTRYTEVGNFNMSAYEAMRKAKLTDSKDDYLPDLVDYVSWMWNTSTFAFQSLGSAVNHNLVEQGTSVYMPTYKTDSNGFLSEVATQVAIFDDAFLEKSLNSIQKDNGQIESLLKAQNRFVRVSYLHRSSYSGNGSNQFMVILTLLLGMIIPMLFAYYIWRTKR